MRGHSTCGISFMAIIAFIAVPFVAPQTTCKNDSDPCLCDLVDGTGKIDLTPIGTPDQARFKGVTIASRDGYSYSYNPCYMFASSDGTYTDLAALETYEIEGYDYDIGQQSTAKFYKQGSTISVTYTSEDTQTQSTVQLVCDKSLSDETVTLDAVSDDSYTYNFTMKGPNVCLNNGSGSGLSAGSVITIIFFVFVFLYLVCGVIYNKKKNDAQGTDLIPNKEFWISIPGLIKDGVLFLVSKCRGQPSSGAYENI